MGELIQGRFGQTANGETGDVPSVVADAVDAFVTFRLVRAELKVVPTEEFQAAASDLMELAVEQQALLDGLSPEDRCKAIRIGQMQLHAEHLGFLPIPDTSESI